MLCYIACVMLCYIRYVMLRYITYVILCYDIFSDQNMLYNMCHVIKHRSCYAI